VNEKIEDFISRRLRELQESDADLRRKLNENAIERNKLLNARALLEGKIGIPEREQNTEFYIKPNTIMAEIMNILGEHPNGLLALDILRIINQTREPPLARSSLSPQLSRLKERQYLDFDGTYWRINEKQGVLRFPEEPPTEGT
jgi:hypothetical protein